MGHVLQFDNNTKRGVVVFDLELSNSPQGTFKIAFNVTDINPDYGQPMEGDRVRMTIECGYDNQPWYVKDGSLEFVCRAEPVLLANAT